MIHAAHGNGEKSLLSGALRLGLPLLGGLTAAAVTPSHPDDEGNDMGYVLAIAGGAIAGAIVAMAIDDFAIARYTTKVSKANGEARRFWQLSPIVSKDIRGVSLALSL